jgi:hypothetical protein
MVRFIETGIITWLAARMTKPSHHGGALTKIPPKMKTRTRLSSSASWSRVASVESVLPSSIKISSQLFPPVRAAQHRADLGRFAAYMLTDLDKGRKRD